MNKKYTEISFDAHTSLEKAVAILQEHNNRGELVCGAFNGHILYSDKVTIDNVYLECFGKSKEEYELAKKKCLGNANQAHAEYESRLPELMENWIAKGQDVLEEKYWNKWEKIVLNQSNFLYENLPEQCLEVVSKLNGGCSLQDAKEVIDGQAHSGGSLCIVLDMIKEVSDKGVALADLF